MKGLCNISGGSLNWICLTNQWLNNNSSSTTNLNVFDKDYRTAIVIHTYASNNYNVNSFSTTTDNVIIEKNIDRTVGGNCPSRMIINARVIDHPKKGQIIKLYKDSTANTPQSSVQVFAIE